MQQKQGQPALRFLGDEACAVATGVVDACGEMTGGWEMPGFAIENELEALKRTMEETLKFVKSRSEAMVSSIEALCFVGFFYHLKLQGHLLSIKAFRVLDGPLQNQIDLAAPGPRSSSSFASPYPPNRLDLSLVATHNLPEIILSGLIPKHSIQPLPFEQAPGQGFVQNYYHNVIQGKQHNDQHHHYHNYYTCTHDAQIGQRDS
ncbi:hypothetical protein Moror_4402 [Moniliophthora roreri MCA 2997]|uniref:Uncharacterized protein n=1 Tax=Moniliophthora roreri (strain MCA 2997) TaxID=1381753 RepID=V2X0F0_MONRO|nr:hypothetical protein Moror_4402 [Moniliophthora roreri MCA 2997]